MENPKSKNVSNSPREKTKRITVDVPEPIHTALKVRAAQEGTTVSDILRSYLVKSLNKWLKSHEN